MAAHADRPSDGDLAPSCELAAAAADALRAVDLMTAAAGGSSELRADDLEAAGRHLRALTARARQDEDDSLTALMISCQDGHGQTAAAMDAVRAMADLALAVR